MVEKVTYTGKKNIKEDMYFYDRISTHKARRTSIIMMKRKGKSEELIVKIIGLNDMKTIIQYYQVVDNLTREAIDEIFDISIPLKNVSES